MTVEDIQRAIDEQMDFIHYHTNIVKVMQEEYGIPRFTAPTALLTVGWISCLTPFEAFVVCHWICGKTG